MSDKYILKYRELLLGDIIIDREESNESHRIRRMTQSDYSHARIYVGDTIMEANGIGVQSVNPQRIVYDSPEDVIVLRCVNANEEELENACLFARSEFAKEHSVRKLNNTQFCFRLVAESYQYAGIELVNEPTRCTANDFLSSRKLTTVPDMVVVANKRDLEIAYSEGIMQDKGHYSQQTEVAYAMFEEIRSFVRSQGVDSDMIQDDDALFIFLIANPSFDHGIAEILNRSPYFSLWEVYKEQKPWEFDAKLLKDKYGNHSKEVAMQMIESCDGQEPKVWARMYTIVSGIKEMYHFESADVYVKLYCNLIVMNHERRTTAEIVLSEEDVD